MGTIEPRQQDIENLSAKFPDGGPVVMINLLRFRETASYPEGSEHEPCSGPEAYARYSAVGRAKLAETGASLLYGGAARTSLIAPEGERWDHVLVISYPSADAFRDMVLAPDYVAASVHRTAALEDSRLIATHQPA